MYIVKISWMNPYPVNSEYRIKASNMASASAKGIRLWRKENKGRKIKNIKIDIIRI